MAKSKKWFQKNNTCFNFIHFTLGEGKLLNLEKTLVRPMWTLTTSQYSKLSIKYYQHNCDYTYSYQAGAIMAPVTTNSFAVSTDIGDTAPKFLTLLLFVIEWSPKSHFWNLFLKFLKTPPKIFLQSWYQRAPCKKTKSVQKRDLFQKIILFHFELALYNFLAFFWGT